VTKGANPPRVTAPRRPATHRRGFGQAIEAAVAQHLERQGLRLLGQNFRAGHGELDLIMQEGITLVFVEVRYRRDGRGAESVDPRKQARLIDAARHYLSRLRGPAPRCRFDVVAVHGEPPTRLQFEWIRAAFTVS